MGGWVGVLVLVLIINFNKSLNNSLFFTLMEIGITKCILDTLLSRTKEIFLFKKKRRKKGSVKEPAERWQQLKKESCA